MSRSDARATRRTLTARPIRLISIPSPAAARRSIVSTATSGSSARAWRVFHPSPRWASSPSRRSMEARARAARPHRRRRRARSRVCRILERHGLTRRPSAVRGLGVGDRPGQVDAELLRRPGQRHWPRANGCRAIGCNSASAAFSPWAAMYCFSAAAATNSEPRTPHEIYRLRLWLLCPFIRTKPVTVHHVGQRNFSRSRKSPRKRVPAGGAGPWERRPRPRSENDLKRDELAGGRGERRGVTLSASPRR